MPLPSLPGLPPARDGVGEGQAEAQGAAGRALYVCEKGQEMKKWATQLV